MIFLRPKNEQFVICRRDISFLPADAIVFPTVELTNKAGGDSFLVKALSKESITEELKEINMLLTPGDAMGKIAPSGLRCRHIIYTKLPVYEGGTKGETALLKSCYQECLKTADELGLESIAFPLLAAYSGAFPTDKALEVAVTTIREYSEQSNLNVILCLNRSGNKQDIDIPGIDEVDALSKREDRLFGNAPKINKTTSASKNTVGVMNSFSAIKSKKAVLESEYMPCEFQNEEASPDNWDDLETEPSSLECYIGLDEVQAEAAFLSSAMSNDFNIKELPAAGESFVEMLMKFELMKDMSDPQVYHKAGITRACFNNIINGRTRNPSRQTIVALAMALELSYDEAVELMEAAGLAFSKNNPFDIIAANCFKAGYYDIWKINVVLAERDLPLIGQQA